MVDFAESFTGTPVCCGEVESANLTRQATADGENLSLLCGHKFGATLPSKMGCQIPITLTQSKVQVDIRNRQPFGCEGRPNGAKSGVPRREQPEKLMGLRFTYRKECCRRSDFQERGAANIWNLAKLVDRWHICEPSREIADAKLLVAFTISAEIRITQLSQAYYAECGR
jgi:hypothetical protein